MINKYKSKPVTIEAVQLSGNNADDIVKWIDDHGGMATKKFGGMIITTLEGDMRANMGDYIIRGTQNEFYPCKETVFKEKYEEVKDN